ncbi:hypothetical protein BN946_scf184829.g19 [Trametes cinnabarina]|uniref:Uncharacterized protein n=1 Tax=Pycnoporus cinnabarinus TaxID=5643 RepID=A0A060S9L7_PYCCI|nr:hypothetical protein BN946_scf184829.g19 [Trametes cinnabarina]
MEAEFEETQQQIRHSTELIQSAFEGLTALHIRITTAALIRAQNRAFPGPSGTQSDQPERSTNTGRNSMDPGHDAILLSSTNSNESSASAAQPNQTSPRRPRISDTALSNLHTEILQSTESVRQRASELEELRRIIGQHNQERHRQEAQPAAQDTPSRSPFLTASTAVSTWDRPISVLASSLPASSRRLLLESSFRQRNMDDSATSLGAMVSARTASIPAAAISNSSPAQRSSNNSLSSFPSRSDVTIASSSSSVPAAARAFDSPISPGLVARLTRLAQEIQRDISRISQQSETLMAWINENRARLDIDPSLLNTNNASGAAAASRDSTSRASPSALPPLESLASNPSPRTPPGAPRVRASSDWRQATAVSAHPMSIRPPPPRSSDLFRAEIRRRGPTVPMSTISLPSEESDGPPARRARLEPPSASSVQAAPGSLGADPELLDAVSRVRGALVRARYRRTAEEADREEEPVDTRTYRVRRRLNADGDEEVMRVPFRRDSALRTSAWRGVQDDSGLGPVTGTPSLSRRADPPADGAARDRRRTRRSLLLADEEQSDDTEWVGAVRRLDALAREAREAEGRIERQDAPGWDLLQALTRDDSRSSARPAGDEAASRSPVNLGSWWRSRALALTSSNPPLRTLSGSTSTLPPPPSFGRPLSLLSTTQTAPGSLWNDSNVRVRLHAAAARLDEDVRSLEAARERAQSLMGQPQRLTQSSSVSSSSSSSTAQAQLQTQAQAATRSARRPQSRFWPFDYRDAMSPSPPLDLDRDGRPIRAQCGPDAGAEGEPERVMWGSPRPFCPSLLPLPAVRECRDDRHLQGGDWEKMAGG